MSETKIEHQKLHGMRDRRRKWFVVKHDMDQDVSGRTRFHLYQWQHSLPCLSNNSNFAYFIFIHALVLWKTLRSSSLTPQAKSSFFKYFNVLVFFINFLILIVFLYWAWISRCIVTLICEVSSCSFSAYF